MLCTPAIRRSSEFVGHFSMALKGSHRRATTSLYLIESLEAERKLAEARKKKKAVGPEISEGPLAQRLKLITPIKSLQRKFTVAYMFGEAPLNLRRIVFLLSEF